MQHHMTLETIALPWRGDLDIKKMEIYSPTNLLSDIKNVDLGRDIALKGANDDVCGWIPYSTFMKEIFKQWKLTKAYYDAFLHSVEAAVTTVDDQGNITFLNQNSEEMYGLSLDKVSGQSITKFFEQEAIVLMSTMKERQGVTNKYNQPHPNVHVLINTSPVYVDEEVVGGISIERDITEMVKLNDELSSTTAYLHELESTNQSQQNLSPFSKIKGRSPVLKEAITLANKVAKTDAPVLITGESGVGKELFAEGIHNAGKRSSHPFVAINCGAIPTALFESELFGYEQGAFTGAVKGGKKGKFDAAKGGTIFLDEIGEMPLELQVKLLRVLQEKHYYRVSGNEAIPTDVRIIAATNRDLEKMIDEGSFREDLYYRLNVISISIPPLRDRIEDIPELIQLFLKEFSLKYTMPIPSIDPEVMYTFLQHPWQGNIRQLRNIIERMIILASDNEVIKPHHLPKNFVKEHNPPTLNIQFEEIKKHHGQGEDEIQYALQKTFGNKAAAAKLLGISRATLYNKLKKYNLKID
ncbi:sigma 54-interacting transcriptional regulator [Alkalihalobacillus sp. MEB130]|uniref:sigma-54 interaction domain-containing protein n=1 Tax=Alkalihalobacillus sp. MEB130 TaxID=2976704 RepID=UPI0028EEF608|nr:sigma 54-interacting transcriptional regulator [Alkalihalobacillus sp. MEB130]